MLFWEMKTRILDSVFLRMVESGKWCILGKFWSSWAAWDHAEIKRAATRKRLQASIIVYIVHSSIINNDLKKVKIILLMLWEAFKLTVPYCTLVIAVFHICALQIKWLFSYIYISKYFEIILPLLAGLWSPSQESCPVFPFQSFSLPLQLWWGQTSHGYKKTNDSFIFIRECDHLSLQKYLSITVPK